MSTSFYALVGGGDKYHDEIKDYLVGLQDAYDVWLESGNEGTREDFIDSLTGPQGDLGDKGDSAYQVWLQEGFNGDEEEFFEYLRGPKGNPSDMNFRTREDFKTFLESGTRFSDATVINAGSVSYESLMGSTAIPDIPDHIPSGQTSNVKAFGAVGDGVTDDSSAFAAAGAYGGDVFVPAGEYYLGSDRVIEPNSNTTFWAVPGTALLVRDSYQDDALSYLHPIFRIKDKSNVAIRGLSLRDEREGANTRELGIEISATSEGSTKDVVVEYCTFIDMKACIAYRFVDGVLFRRNAVLGGANAQAGFGTGGVINSTGGTENLDGVVRNIRCEYNFFHATRNEAVDINWHTHGFWIENNTIVGCHTAAGGEVIDIGGTDDGSTICRSGVVRGNDISLLNDSGGIQVKQRSEDVEVYGNTIVGPDDPTAGYGLKVSHGKPGVAFHSNTIRSVFDAILMTSSSEDVKITSNNCENLKRYGLYAQDGEGYNNCDLSGNTFRAGALGGSDGVFLGTAYDCDLSNTKLFGFSGYGYRIAPDCDSINLDGSLAKDITGQAGFYILSPNSSCRGAKAKGCPTRGFWFQATDLDATSIVSEDCATDTTRKQVNVTGECDRLTLVGFSIRDTQDTPTARGLSFEGPIDRAVVSNGVIFPFAVTAVSNPDNVTNPSGKTAGIYSDVIDS